jgi:hypothetical protein
MDREEESISDAELKYVFLREVGYRSSHREAMNTPR